MIPAQSSAGMRQIRQAAAVGGDSLWSQHGEPDEIALWRTTDGAWAFPRVHLALE